MMTVERVIEILSQYPGEGFADVEDRVTTEALVSMLERQIPMEPVHNEKLVPCGWPDVYDCADCGNQLRSFAKFCDKCGRPILRKEDPERKRVVRGRL